MIRDCPECGRRTTPMGDGRACPKHGYIGIPCTCGGWRSETDADGVPTCPECGKKQVVF